MSECDQIRRVAMLSVHTSPLEQPGTGDAGGMNVYVIELSKRLAARNIGVEIYTRATSSRLPPVVEAFPGVHVHHVHAGPFEGLRKEELPPQLCTFAREVLLKGGRLENIIAHGEMENESRRLVSRNGDIIEVLTSKAMDAGPSRDWLAFVNSDALISCVEASSPIRSALTSIK